MTHAAHDVVAANLPVPLLIKTGFPTDFYRNFQGDVYGIQSSDTYNEKNLTLRKER